jgi:hypothetical protein
MLTGATLVAFLVRLLATAGIVLAVTVIVGRLGPRIGGVVAGLPIVVGPGLAFIALDKPSDYLVEAAGFVLVSLIATQAFMFAYARAARSLRPAPSLSVAVAAWLAAIAILALPTLPPVAATLLFTLAAFVSAHLLRRTEADPATPPVQDGWTSLLLRAGLAGIMVGAISLGAQALGPRIAGLLLAYPVGMTVIAVTIHQRHGAPAVIGTLAAAALGTLSIGAFALAVALLTSPLGAAPALLLALGASLLVSLLLLHLRRRSASSGLPSG